ncbi:MAG TPA: NAD-dependent succinate-semialdehyde dehydrogenase, partial [Candidatus Saccharimonadales bacterium]|nr:NAD-dependent succinate-semialdehyde dehydrogenase [Candidatus Saccharimonadales bacterium]
RAAGLLEERSGEHAALMALEMGKPLAEGAAESRKCAAGCRYFAANAEAFLRPDPRECDGASAEVRHEPLGPILAIMPWNFPFWQFFRFAAPALMAGNVAILKHAPCTPRCALAIERLLLEAGFPQGVVRNLFLTDDQAARLIADDRLAGVTLTGSTRAASQVARSAGRSLKTMVMELGGSDPFIVLEDAEIDAAVATGVAARCQNGGQSCIAAKRFIVHRSLHDRFLEGLVAGMRSLKMGDPTDPEVRIGPLARRDLRDRLAEQVDRSVACGARVLCGGEVPAGKGWFYPPTVLTNVPEEAPACDEEIFGPVAPVFPFDTDEEALRLANATRYGLGASLWTRSRERAERMVPELEAGAVFINGMVRSDPRLPFGGVKRSGFGRELSREGLLEFVNVKTVWMG